VSVSKLVDNYELIESVQTLSQICFPRQPLLRIEGPLAIGQLLETTLLNLVNFPSLIATNAARMRLVAGPAKTLLEFGLRYLTDFCRLHIQCVVEAGH
jgi:nicotinic acid phosphoribosyltransferase